MPKIPVTIIVEDSAMKSFPRIARAVKKAGMHVSKEMPTIGQMTGEVDSIQLAKVSRVAGVQTVETGADTFRLPPPTSKNQ